MQDFHDELIALLPGLRLQARALTRDRARAEDLVHDAVCNALAAKASFTPGTNMAGWMHRILRNRFISDVRARRDLTPLDELVEPLLVKAPHENRVALRELGGAIARLPEDQRTALLLVSVEGMSYEELAGITGTAVGTAKSRVFRARRQLQAWLLGETPEAAPRTAKKPRVSAKIPAVPRPEPDL